MLSDSNRWVPTPKQEAFLSVPFTVKEAFYAGALMAGKSDVLMLYPVIHKLHENPRFKGLYLRRTFKQLENEIIPRSHQFFPLLGAKFNESKKLWTFPNKNKSISPMGAGALFFFGHCEDEDHVHNYDTMQPNYVGFDELTSFTEWQYLYITLERCRTTIYSDLPAIVRSASNPGNIGHTWVRKRFIDPCPEGFKLIQNKAGIKRIFIPATIKDNPYVDPEYIKSLESLPEAERKAKLGGDWSAYEGQVFDEFRDRKYPDEPDNAIHVIEPFEIPTWWPRIYAIDWGFAPPAFTCVLYGAISPSKRVYIYREQLWQKHRILEWAPYVREFIETENPRQIQLCQSSHQDRGQVHTVESEINNALGVNCNLTTNKAGSRVAGKMLLHEYLRWKPKYIPQRELAAYDPDFAQSLLRQKSLKDYHEYLKSFEPPEIEENLPKLQIFDNCKKLIDAIRACSYDPDNPQDVAEFPGDDPYDTVRYLIDAADRFFDESRAEYDKLQQAQILTQELQQSNDWTSYYRKAEFLENRGQRDSSVVVRRYARRR